MSTPTLLKPAAARSSIRASKIVARRGIDHGAIRKAARRLLESGMNDFQKRLNANLLEQLGNKLHAWLLEVQQEISLQLKSVPRYARETWLAERLPMHDRRRPENQAVRFLTDFLFSFVRQELRELTRLRSASQRFRKTFSKIHTDSQRQKLLLDYAGELGATRAELKSDQKAFERWFDEEAVSDRYAMKIGSRELLLAFAFDRLSESISIIFRIAGEDQTGEASDRGETQPAFRANMTGMWQRLNIEDRIQDGLVYTGDDRVRVAVMGCLHRAITSLPDGLGTELIDPTTKLFIRRAAVEGNSDVWVQCQALSILTALSWQEARPVLERRLAIVGNGDDMFVRRHALKLIEQQLLRDPLTDITVPELENEPSEFVRQKIASVAFHSTRPEIHELWSRLACYDPAPKVRAAAILVGLQKKKRSLEQTQEILNLIANSLQQEKDPFVLRTAMHVATRMLHAAESVKNTRKKRDATSRSAIRTFFDDQIMPQLRRLQCEHESVPVRRWAAQNHEQIWASTDDDVRQLMERLRPKLLAIGPSGNKDFPKQWFAGLPPEKLGRLFAVLAQNDFGYDIQPGWLSYRVHRGTCFGFRLWRLIYELRNPATDKRQGLSHTIGRISTATMRAPSQICSELSETKVPGEPLMNSADGSWRPFLPLVDDLISVLNMSWIWPRQVAFFTSQGITKVRAPRFIWQRCWASIRLNLEFARFAEQRNWQSDTTAPTAFIESLRKLGFRIQFEPYPLPGSSNTNAADQAEPTDASVYQFFAAGAPLGPLMAASMSETSWSNQLHRFAEYFGSAFENTLEELVVFALLFMLIVIGRHWFSNFTFRRARKKIPLSIGGWGTRGKSGTERLKAALFGVMGHGMVSKTTGCEAMFIQSYPYGEPLEIPLFRPYDKATIWEHRNLIMMASRMEPSVFLWECMALNPAYVDVLQRQWTQDDLSTITNTYPDHEDIQGPAGHNVAQTIAGFVPQEARLLTTEQQMLPYVTEACHSRNTDYESVGWLESGLITKDVLQRFPYTEHPDNVALVAAMARHLGCDYEFALKAMADYLVPDLGVLKTYPRAEIRTRTIEFTNGMSANERFGCMGNWRRLGFDQLDPWQEPATWICGVINNRADRVPRSRVFASIMVDDLSADRFFLIGNNLKGMQGFIDEAWQENRKSFSLHRKGQIWDTAHAVQVLRRTAREFRIPIEQSHIHDRLRVMIEAVAATCDAQLDVETCMGSSDDPNKLEQRLDQAGLHRSLTNSMVRHLREWNQSLEEYRQIENRVRAVQPLEAKRLEQEIVQILKRWFQRKIVVVENYEATGEQVLARIVDETPPGFLNRTMGLQNIKGTGLDFVYRFQSWDDIVELCDLLLSKQSEVAEQALQSMLSMNSFGQLAHARIKQTIQLARQSQALRQADLQSQLDELEQQLQCRDPGIWSHERFRCCRPKKSRPPVHCRCVKREPRFRRRQQETQDARLEPR